MVSFTINGKKATADAAPDTPLLWVVRDHLGLTGTKYGCGKALCGACTVHIDGRARRSSVTPVQAALGKSIITIEGLNSKTGQAVQAAWEQLDVVQCGYCQSGQIMSALAMLEEREGQVTDAEIDAVMSANICRCGTYPRIRKAIKRAAQEIKLTKKEAP